MVSAVMARSYSKVRNELLALRDIRGNTLPEPLVEKLVSLSEGSDYHFAIGSAQNERFFRQNARAMRFFDSTGTEFTFTDVGRISRRNQTFAGIAYLHSRKIVRVYVHFAYT